MIMVAFKIICFDAVSSEIEANFFFHRGSILRTILCVNGILAVDSIFRSLGVCNGRILFGNIILKKSGVFFLTILHG